MLKRSRIHHLAFFFTILLFVSFYHCATAQKISIHKREAQQAYRLLNDIRKNPEKYARELQLSNLKKVSRKPLRWNNTLAKVAGQRALDMAKRNYFDHVSPDGYGANYYIHKGGYTLTADWLKDRRSNYFESIGANHPSAVAGIKSLVRGSRQNNFAHRVHLLGMDDWNGSLYDVGIGFATGGRKSTYKTYLVVLIAKHNW